MSCLILRCPSVPGSVGTGRSASDYELPVKINDIVTFSLGESWSFFVFLAEAPCSLPAGGSGLEMMISRGRMLSGGCRAVL